ncbi:LysR family transcriptional regulator [Mangrovibrevibacter kandeliae]|uniref:LysR family transcriptional regulator n=1 Tax=Mangrovibrevibacter kandeliae TaxID=2968473 RepID=UPI002119AAB4|nr:LysR family transcriptional regulator [Aurantimonas sp. CSK15Z-1]MCQ8783855.1 LysR family transcriptional regulator [Aurantimonas sp. CSK15Z-1]
MARNLDLDLLRTFVASADCASMTRAAQQRNLTQGAVSQQMKRLEVIVGAPLVNRDRRGLQLTASGAQLLPRARRMIELNDETVDVLSGQMLAGHLTLGVPPDLVGSLVGPLLRRYAELHPSVQVSLLSAASPALSRMGERGEVDLALVEEPASAVTGECLRVERLQWAGAKGGGAHRRTPLPVSLVAENCAFRPVLADALDAAGLSWRSVFEGGGIEATTATVRMDLAVAAWLASTLPPDLEVLGVEAGLPALPSFAIVMHLPRRPSRAAQEMARLLRDDSARRPDSA